MSGRGDYSDEMRTHRPLDDDTIDEILTGAAYEDSLRWFVEDVAFAATGPEPVPSAALAAMLVTGLSTENGDLPVTAASNVPGPAAQGSGLPKRRKKKMLIPQFIAGLSLFGKAALGVGAAAAATGAAGAAGVLPDPVQHAVASTVDTVTPFSFPDKANSHADIGNKTSTDARDGTHGVDGQQVATDAKANRGATDEADAATSENGIGATVSADAKVDGVDGAAVTSTATANAEASAQIGLDHITPTPAQDHTPTSIPATPARGKP